jgi:hypothetical protein
VNAVVVFFGVKGGLAIVAMGAVALFVIFVWDGRPRTYEAVSAMVSLAYVIRM